MIFKNIFSSYYSFFLSQKAEDPIFASVNLLTIAFTVWSMLIGVLVKRYTGFDFTLVPYPRFLLIGFMLFLLFFLFKYYTKAKEKIKINDSVKVFNAKTTGKKFLWNTISFTFLILPILLIALTLNKYIFR